MPAEPIAHALSHDLREPIRGMRIYAEILARQTGDDAETTAKLLGQADRVDAMLSALVRFLRLESRPLRRERIDLRHVIEQASHRLQRRIGEAGATLSTGALPAVTGDPDDLIDAFVELIDNAMSFDGSGRPAIHIAGEEREDGTVQVVVADAGIGIPESHAGAVFDLFRRLHPAGAFNAGVGMGLPIARRLIERQGGSLVARPRAAGVDSADELAAAAGTELVMTLPAAADD